MRIAALLLALAASTNAFLAPLHPQRVNVELAAKKKKKKQVMSPSGDAVQATVLIEKADAVAADAIDLSKQAAALADDGAANVPCHAQAVWLVVVCRRRRYPGRGRRRSARDNAPASEAPSQN